MTNNTTLVLGSNGKTGRRVVERLEAMGLDVRKGSRPAFDWEDDSTWAPIVRDVHAVYITYYPDLAFPGALDRIRTFTEIAVTAGVRRLVLLSGRNEELAQEAEQVVLGAGVEATVVRCSWFMQNFDEGWLLDPVLSGTIALPAGEVTEPFVDVEDIADVATAALTQDGHAGKVYELTGPRLISFAEAAATISAATGREVAYVSVTPEEFAAGAIAAGVPEDEAHGLNALFAEVLDGRNENLADGVRQALGRPARDFAEYAEQAAPAWKV
ncbi:NmrA family transcriptional regulator [Nonomuraea sp. NPDC050540]|uniref:NmrA family transcriptional regulator n=1 Tax=Nonomuraea sp. NPDC050540 TaxID=3364367 RepID=UPI00378D1002